MRTLRLTYVVTLAAVLITTAAFSSEAHASSKSDCYFDVKIVKRPSQGKVFEFTLLRISTQHRSIGSLCEYMMRAKNRLLKAELRSSDASALARLQVSATTVLRLDAASWCGGGPTRRCGSYRRWHLVAAKPNPATSGMATTAPAPARPAPDMATPRPAPRPAPTPGAAPPASNEGCSTGGSAGTLLFPLLGLGVLLLGRRRRRA